ncbi:MAG: CPBP family intramembrane glutamic endopeptidase [Halarcobacter sp.]
MNTLKYIEFLTFFIILPLLFFFKIISLKLLIPILWLVALYSIYILLKTKTIMSFKMFDLNELKLILIRFILISMLVFLFTKTFYSELLFVFVKENFLFYILVMFLYPLLSVVPQEIIFRKFFLFRYKENLSTKYFVLVNAIVFGFIHIVFSNYIAVVFSLIGGFIFMSTYLKTRSFTLVCIEHALYGNMIFTIGLGNFFYHNANM